MCARNIVLCLGQSSRRNISDGQVGTGDLPLSFVGKQVRMSLVNVSVHGADPNGSTEAAHAVQENQRRVITAPRAWHRQSAV